MKSWWLLALFTPSGGIPKNDLGNNTLQNIFNVVLALAGAVAVAYIVWSGIQYSTSAGDAAKTKQARETIIYALVGLVVVMLSFVIVNFIVGRM